MKRRLSLQVAAALLLFAPSAFPCTTFLAEHAGQPVFGRNYDWSVGSGMVTTNPRGLAKTAFFFDTTHTPAAWTSKYASLTFNQGGAEFPNGGINEKGLVVEVMWLDSSQYPASVTGPAINEMQWIQYALDNYASVAELVAAAPSVGVVPVIGKVHYLTCDTSKVCAAVEYVGGKQVITTGSDMPVKTLSNDTYAASATYLAQFTGFGGTLAVPTSASSLDRFVRASALAQTKAGTTIPTSGYGILDSVAQTNTKWSIVYVPTEGTVHFQTTAMRKIKIATLSGFSLDCHATRKILDIDKDATGDVTAMFEDFTSEKNKAFVTAGLVPMASQLPAGAADLIVAYPATCVCKGTPVADGGVAGSDAPSNDPASAGSEPAAASGCSCRAAPARGTWGWLALLGLSVARVRVRVFLRLLGGVQRRVRLARVR
jgi:penicillin V acylase-like amidase (Ntn superfamily)